MPAHSTYDGGALDLAQLGAYATLLEPGTCATTRIALTGKVGPFAVEMSYGGSYACHIEASSLPAARRDIRVNGDVDYRGANTCSYPAKSYESNCY